MLTYQNVPKKTRPKRTVERQLLFAVTLVLIILLANLIQNQQNEFQQVRQGYKDGTVLNLQKGFDEKILARILKSGNYLSDDADVAFAASVLADKLTQRKRLANLGYLNKNDMSVTAAYADSMGGPGIRNHVAASRTALHFDRSIEKLYQSPNLLSSGIDAGFGGPSVKVTITDESNHGVEGVIVILQQHFLAATDFPSDSLRYDTTRFAEGGFKVRVFSNDKTVQRDAAYTRYGRSAKDGIVTFSSLQKNGSYSVLPVRKEFEYGASKGTVQLRQDISPVFIEKIQTIKLFNTVTYTQLKEDKVFTVRTPDEYLRDIFIYVTSFLLVWWLVHLYWGSKGGNEDQLIMPLLMLLSGLCIIVMYAIHDPLRDFNRGNEMAQGAILGALLLFIISRANIVSFYNSRWFDALGNGFGKKLYQQPGYVYLLAAFALSILLMKFGKGPDGSEVKVNLNVGISIQPSEIIKYLVVVFFAAYFSKKAGFLQNIPDLGLRIKNSLPVFILLGCLMGIYLYLGDMGPALVLCGTFIIFYSVARGDYAQLAIGVFSYILLMVIGGKALHGSKLLLLAFTGVWLLAWMVYGLIAKKTIYESAVFLVFIISAFIFGEDLPNVGQRLKDRNDIYNDIWNNETYGGDQVAHGIWSITSGGLTGQGLGLGDSKVMPANHTDMVLGSIGEELGFTGLLVIVSCMAILLHRSLLIARKSGHPFAFYLAAGIVVVTGIQFLIITAGSLGIMPLTGITVPFLSYGRVSMVINIAAFGAVLSISKLTGNSVQKNAIQETYDNTIFFGSFSYTIASLGILAVLLYYQCIAPDSYIVKPALVVNKMGMRIFSSNPRIPLLMKELDAGNIYDRNKLLLATGKKEVFLAAKEQVTNAGVADSIFNKQSLLKLRRYYPFGDQMFFWLGDFNTRLMWGSSMKGYFAENKHLTALRGFDTSPEGSLERLVPSARYKEDRFLPPHPESFPVVDYNYKELIPLLKAGLNSVRVKEFNLVKRDITLTVDAALQTRLQNEILDATTRGKFNKGWRSSVIVINAGNGEVLASALHPLPDLNSLKELAALSPEAQLHAINDITLNGKTITESDLGTTFPSAPGSIAKVMSGLAGLNKLGVERASKIKYFVYEEERFRDVNSPEPVGYVNMDTAIVKSSNVFFIKLINEEALDDELTKIYQAVGIGIDKEGAYFFYNNHSVTDNEQHRQFWQTHAFSLRRPSYFNQLLSRKKRLLSEFSYLAWGQGTMTATPLAMARLTGAVANGGIMRSSKFVLAASTTLRLQPDTAVRIAGVEESKLMEQFMIRQSAVFSTKNGVRLAGKTGSPKREVPGNTDNFDGWYMFSTYSEKLSAPIAVCIRMERATKSANAMMLAAEVVLPALRSLAYIK